MRPTARKAPPMPSGAATIEMTSSSADAIGTMRSERRSVKGIVE
jgi:hypothetical protein